MGGGLANVYGNLLIVRGPAPANVNKGGANYKSEVAYLEYSPRRAWDEWLSICEGILACGGDALFEFEAEDEPLLDAGDLSLHADGSITPAGSAERLGRIDDVLTGRVFSANGPWVVREGTRLRALMPNMLAHRRKEEPYYHAILERIAEAAGCTLAAERNPHRWEGMADVAAVGDRVVLTYTVPGHYDAGTGPKTMRTSREGAAAAADFAGVPEAARLYAELVFPHFHGDTVHFGARPAGGPPVLVQYGGGLFGDGARRIREALGPKRIVPIERDDAVDAYAANSRQVGTGLLVPDGASPAFTRPMEALGLAVRRVPLFELFGKAGGGPACATLYLPADLKLPGNAPMRYSVRRAEAASRRERIPAKLTVDPGFFEGRPRG